MEKIQRLDSGTKRSFGSDAVLVTDDGKNGTMRGTITTTVTEM